MTNHAHPTRRTVAAALLGGFALCALLLAAPAQPSAAQDPTPILQRAQRTLDELDALLARIEARREAGGGPSAGAQTGGGWRPLFDGRSLAGWKPTDFAGGGEVTVEPGFRGGPPAIVVQAGATLSGFNWTGAVPRTGYEIALEMLKIDGNDFPCGLTFPVGDSYASLILGGWGGGVVGISSIDNRDASENDTTKYLSFPKDRWYRVRMRVMPDRLEAWLDDNQVVDQVITGHKISLRPGEISRSIPLGIATYQTAAAFRNIRLRTLDSK